MRRYSDVDPLQPAGRAHEQGPVVHHEVAPLDELDPHLLREERVLEVGGVVDARGQHRDARAAGAPGGHPFEGAEQPARIVADRTHREAVEDLRERLLHDRPVLQHAGDAGRAAQVVLEHVDGAVSVAHEVGAGDVAPDAARGVEAGALAAVPLRALHHVGRHHAVGHDAAVVIDVVDEVVQGGDALLQAALDLVPRAPGDDAGHNVEGEDAFGAVSVVVDVERDPHSQEGARGRLLTAQQLPFGQPLDALDEGTRLARQRQRADSRASASRIRAPRRMPPNE